MTIAPQGFTLYEVLLTLLLVSGTALGLLTQQYQAARLLTESMHHTHRMMNDDNHLERFESC